MGVDDPVDDVGSSGPSPRTVRFGMLCRCGSSKRDSASKDVVRSMLTPKADTEEEPVLLSEVSALKLLERVVSRFNPFGEETSFVS